MMRISVASGLDYYSIVQMTSDERTMLVETIEEKNAAANPKGNKMNQKLVPGEVSPGPTPHSPRVEDR
jgi:hypothetical protein